MPHPELHETISVSSWPDNILPKKMLFPTSVSAQRKRVGGREVGNLSRQISATLCHIRVSDYAPNLRKPQVPSVVRCSRPALTFSDGQRPSNRVWFHPLAKFLCIQMPNQDLLPRCSFRNTVLEISFLRRDGRKWMVAPLDKSLPRKTFLPFLFPVQRRILEQWEKRWG